MTKSGIFILTLVILSVNALGIDSEFADSRQNRDDWFGLDKLKHLSSSFMITTTAYYFQSNAADISSLNSRWNAGIVTISLGLGKEIFDSKKPGNFFSWRDLTMDAVGVGIALFFIQRVDD